MKHSHAELLAILNDGPLHITEIAARFGRKQSTTASRLRDMRVLGLANTTKRGGCGALWALYGLAMRLRAEHEAMPPRVRHRIHNKRDRTAKKLSELASHERWAETAPVRRVVSAADAPPLKVRAANSSIFTLAQSA